MPKIDWHYWSKFLEELEQAKEELNASKTAWYRGVVSEDHLLVPSLLRIPGGLKKEQHLFERFAQIWRALNSSARSEFTDWDLLFEMQHYSVPTRLLDWTETLGVAVFFATLERNDKDSFIYVLNPIALNQLVGKDDLIGQWDRERFGYRNVFWRGDPFKPQNPIAINPLHSNPRLAAQRGRFTVHGVDIGPLEVSCGSCVRKIRLSKDAKPAAAEFLRMAGIDELDVFPDVAGAARFLMNMVGLR
ncbi:MAG TPA: FRG domain-containing protein [Allosphingosinicella sp.]|jgi:hypothetical protein